MVFVLFWSENGLTGVQFAHFGLESGRYSFRRNHREECMYLLFQFQTIRKEREICEFERYFKKFFVCILI